MKVVPRCAAPRTRVCACVCVHEFSFHLCHSVKSPPPQNPSHPPRRNKKSYGMLSTVMQIRFNWLFVYMLHSAARGTSLTPSSKNWLAVVFSLKVPYSTHSLFNSASHPTLHRRGPVTQLATHCQKPVLKPVLKKKFRTTPSAAVRLRGPRGSNLTRQHAVGPRPCCCAAVAQPLWLLDQLSLKNFDSTLFGTATFLITLIARCSSFRLQWSSFCTRSCPRRKPLCRAPENYSLPTHKNIPCQLPAQGGALLDQNIAGARMRTAEPN